MYSEYTSKKNLRALRAPVFSVLTVLKPFRIEYNGIAMRATWISELRKIPTGIRI